MITDIETINKIYKLYTKINYYMVDVDHLLLYNEFVRAYNKYDMPFQEVLLHYLKIFSYIFDKDLLDKLTELCKSEDRANHYIALELVYEAHVKNNI